MHKTKLFKAIFLSILCLGAEAYFLQGFAEEQPSVLTINTNPISTTASPSEINISLEKVEGYAKKVNLNTKDYLSLYSNAADRFVQGNTRASWDDFKSIISNIEDNDFLCTNFANKMADIGFFDLANIALSKTKDPQLSGITKDALKRFYMPSRKIKFEDELFMAEIYSNIMYNNQSLEATNDLLKKESFLSNYDYANYLVALGSYKSNAFKQAAKYINIAIIQNPTNLNYQVLKAKILVENEQDETALKTVEELKRQNLYAFEYERKIKSLEQFILYKTKKAQWEKDYHLGYYFYIENDPSKAVRMLQSALVQKKRPNKSMVNALLSEIYLSIDEFEKASDTANKAHKEDRNNSKALITLGDLSFRNQNYKQALEYYKKAASQDKKSFVPLVKEAKVYQKIENNKKAAELYAKILKTRSDCWEAYYNTALMDKSKESIYLKKALAVNPLFEPAWVDLARLEIDNSNFDNAQKYLANAFYIDENDFRYYYYQGLININSGDNTQARYNFMKCLKLNKNFEQAQKALENTNFNLEKTEPSSI